MEYNIYTDGACLHNPGGCGGWAYAVQLGNDPIGTNTIINSGGCVSSSANRMELTAVYMAFLYVMDHPGKATIYTDSKYISNAINLFLKTWAENGWTGSEGKKIVHADLFREIYSIIPKVNVTVEWLKGHEDNPFNNLVDGQARKSAIQFKSASTAFYDTVEPGSLIAVKNGKYSQSYAILAKFVLSGMILIRPESGRGKRIALTKQEFDAKKFMLIR